MTLTHTRPERELRLSPEVLHRVDIHRTIETLRSEPLYDTNGRNGITLVKNPELRVVLQTMRAGACIHEHHAPGPIIVQVLGGEIEFGVGEVAHLLAQGDLLTLPAGVPHAVRAVCDSAFLLTIAPMQGAR